MKIIEACEETALTCLLSQAERQRHRRCNNESTTNKVNGKTAILAPTHCVSKTSHFVIPAQTSIRRYFDQIVDNFISVNVVWQTRRYFTVSILLLDIWPSTVASRESCRVAMYVQESSARLTNQRVSYAFISSMLSFHARRILPTSKFQHSYSCILLIFYKHQ